MLTPLAITGGQIAPWMLTLIVLLLGSGTALLMLWRLNRQEAWPATSAELDRGAPTRRGRTLCRIEAPPS